MINVKEIEKEVKKAFEKADKALFEAYTESKFDSVDDAVRFYTSVFEECGGTELAWEDAEKVVREQLENYNN